MAVGCASVHGDVCDDRITPKCWNMQNCFG